MNPVRIPRTRYAHSSGASIAYQVVGEGPFDLVVISGPASHLELMWEEPGTAHCFEQVANGRLIRPQSVYLGPKDSHWVPVEKR